MRATQENALKFFHQRAGSKLGAATWDKSIGCGYPLSTKSGKTKIIRMGSGGSAVILIDSNQSARPIIVEKLVTDDLPDSAADINIINQFDSRFSIRKSVIEWMISEERVYPFVSIIVTKATNRMKRNIALSENSSAVMLIHSDKVERFDATEAADMIKGIRELKKPSEWRKAAYAREAMNVAQLNVSVGDYEKNIVELEKSRMHVPDEVALPKPGTMLFEVIKGLSEEKPSTVF